MNLAFATLDTGSAWYVYGATMAELLRKTLPAGSNIDVKPRAGGVGNPRLVAKNETPLGLAFTVTNRWAAEGKEAYTEKHENLRGLVGGLDTYYLVAMATKKLGITSVREHPRQEDPGEGLHAAGGLARRVRGPPAPARDGHQLQRDQGLGRLHHSTSATTSSSMPSRTAAPTSCSRWSRPSIPR